MLRLAVILCGALAIGSLVCASSDHEINDLILSRLDLARLSQLRVELRKLEPTRRCSILEQELNGMFGDVLPSQGPHGLFGSLVSYLSQRQLPFQNNQPVLEDMQMCMQLSGEPSGLAPQNMPIQREVIRSPPMSPQSQSAPTNPMHTIQNEFNDIKNKVKDVGQDLYKYNPMNSFNHDQNSALHPKNEALDGHMTSLDNTIHQGIDVSRMANGAIPYGYQQPPLPPNGPYADHYSSSQIDPPVADYNQIDSAHRAIERGVDRMKDKLGDIVEDTMGNRMHPGDEYHHQKPMVDARRTIEGQMDHMEHHLKDIVEDAADGRLDGIKGHMPAYGHDQDHYASQENVHPDMPYYNSQDDGYMYDEAHHHEHQHDQAHNQEHYGQHAEPIDPRTLPSKKEMKHAQRKVEGRIDELQNRLHNIVADAADGRLDGRVLPRAGPYHHMPEHMGGHQHGASHRMDKIKDTLDEIEDARDGRIDDIKSRMGLPNARHYHGPGQSLASRYPTQGYHSRGGSFSRMLERGIDKLNYKLKEPNMHEHSAMAASGGYEFADRLLQLHEMMSYNYQESPAIRCDRFSTLLSSSPMSHEQVRYIASKPLNKLATGRPLAESRPVIQAMLQEYGNLFMSSTDGLSQELGDELLRCASMASQSEYLHADPYQHGTGYPSHVYPGMGAPMYSPED